MTTIVFTDDLWRDVTAKLELEPETAGVIVAGIAADPDEQTLFARSIEWVPDACYLRREHDILEIASAGFVPALKQAAEDRATALFLHTHPGASPQPSKRDDGVDAALTPVFRLRTGQSLYGSVILGGDPDSPRFSGRVFDGEREESITRLRVVGPRLHLLTSDDRNEEAAVFDRQIRAFGSAGQRVLRGLHAGVVGLGGTGSAVFEQLVRLGVGRITAIDDDIITISNVTRIHESGAADVNASKVDLAAKAAERIGLGTNVNTVFGRITDESVAKALRHCDVVFGCTDDNRGRAILSRMAYWYLLPVIDTAFLVDVDDGDVRGLFGRVTTVVPGVPCLMCRRRIDPAALQAEALPSDERERLAAEGYVPGLGEPDPSVGAFTTLAAMYGIIELLQRIFGFGRQPPPSELLLRVHDREISTTSANPAPHHYCADRAKWGRGDMDPFLEQLWA
jgi:molybdopterin/thiamine biosynthesis adenylyltransferase